ncbi:hypothetical protein HHL25_02815 [Rhizobium sp. S-51]|uniref:Uncharacterized protein n=1 Tax=Rhizobium terricola TaxID=2728849 RepID=A0A7Y0FUS9_9HYPH|nr:hypothetical protein [Rhizobium terricola]NML73051.1 hypothetical protein [Rhizobium terricola]
MMFGPAILARTLSIPSRIDEFGRSWQYHSRSDHHSKVACWGIIFDLMTTCPLLRRHVENGSVFFGINHEMRDFVHDRKKNLDLVLCTAGREEKKNKPLSLNSMTADLGILLDEVEAGQLESLPLLSRAPVGSVLMALEAKACMTAHQKALPRLYDELNSSHATVHGSNDQAIAAGFAMVNMSTEYLSPDRNKGANIDLRPSSHAQPKSAQITVDKLRQLPKRSRPGEVGYDAFAIVVVDCKNDGSAIKVVTGEPAPQAGDIFNYEAMIERLAHIYATRFKDID